MEVTLRKFDIDDIPNKLKWINDNENNEYLHYNIPLNIEDTTNWYNSNINNENRHDMIIQCDGVPVGVIGIINISKKKGEYYITLGEKEYKRKGVSYEATKQILDYAFDELGLEKVWLCVDDLNLPAKKLYEKIGFKQEGLLRKDIYFKNKMIDRCMYGIVKDEWKNEHINN